MGKFNMDTADKYGSNGGGGGFFSLKNDMDVASVRFLYNDVEDVEGYAVHQIEVDGKKRYVNCIREYNEPVDNCPFCRARKPQYAKLFIPLYNEDEEKVQIWERGKTFFSKISSIVSRYGTKGPIVQKVFEVERHGKAGDQKTVYEIYPTDVVSDVTLDDYEVPNVLGSLILDKSAEDMDFYLEEGYFPPTDDETPVRRGSQAQHATGRREQVEEEEAPVRRARRRVPSNNAETF